MQKVKEFQKLDKLKNDHKMLDKQINELYNMFKDDETLTKLKKQKLLIKDKIRKLEELLKD